MRNSRISDWSSVWLDTVSLGLEASAVVGLRLGKIALGGKAGRDESRLMVSEKIGAALEMQAKLGSDMTSSPLRRSQTVLGHYGRVVRANRKRLSHH